VNAKPAAPSPRYQALIQLLRTAETLWNASRLLFARWELSPSQFNVLNLLVELPEGLSQIDLSRALLMHRSNVTGLVDRLEKRGLLARQETPGDRRSYRVQLTDQGLRLMKEILPHYHQAAEEVWGDLPNQRAARLRSDLQQVCAQAENMALAFEH
jgi:DNA-binding MarR family transcriptional regulator